MIVLVCGGRSFQRKEWLFRVLDMFNKKYTIVELVNGGAIGADELARAWARDHDVPIKLFKADWNRYGRGAGMIRNSEMANYLTKYDKNLVMTIAFPGGNGTKDMIQKSRSRGIPVMTMLEE